jgi:predicted ATP-dependent serine protease
MVTERAPKALFGISGLDDILSGGLARNRLYLLEGNPGSGKTTLAPSRFQKPKRSSRSAPDRMKIPSANSP